MTIAGGSKTDRQLQIHEAKNVKSGRKQQQVPVIGPIGTSSFTEESGGGHVGMKRMMIGGGTTAPLESD